jgi:hypothetical protein
MANEVVTKEKDFVVPDMGGIYSSQKLFNGALTLAKSFSRSPLVPKEFQGNDGSCLIAIDMASRCKMSPLMVMQNIYIVYNKPGWSSKFIIALINQSRRYATPLQFTFNDEKTSCYAWAKTHDNEIVTGPIITIEMAKKEGWYGKSGSKWQTMPELMLRYRAASFFGNTNCSDLLMGIPSTDEIIDYTDEKELYESRVFEEIKENANSEEIGFEDIPENDEAVEVKDNDDLDNAPEEPNF